MSGFDGGSALALVYFFEFDCGNNSQMLGGVSQIISACFGAAILNNFLHGTADKLSLAIP